MTNKQLKKKFKIHPAPIAGITAAILTLAFFNAQLIAAMAIAYIAPSSVMAQEEIINTPNMRVDDIPRIVIPKIGVQAPTIYGMNSVKEQDVQKALEKGVLHFGGSPLPGQPGNSVFVAHSSNLPWAAGDYKFVFMLLEKLEPGDSIYLDFNRVRYTYEVTDKKVVKPTDVSVLEGSLYPKATFITCTPIGTNTNRLVVSAKLISPDPQYGTEEALVRSAPELNEALPGRGVDVFGK